MRPPPLPDVFSNYALGGDFTEVVPPPDISWWPQTPGWFVAAALLGLYLLYRATHWYRAWRRNRYRREAGRELSLLTLQQNSATLVAALSDLLKRTALAAFPRREVAALTGTAWVEFLNSRCEAPLFEGPVAAALARGQYRCEPLPADTRRALLDAVRQWIRRHRGPGDA